MSSTPEQVEPAVSDEEDLTQATDSQPTTTENETEELSLDIIFEALKNKRRRQAINHLNEPGERVTLSDLAEHIAAIENDTTPELLGSQQRKRVYIALYQCHLPKLDSMGIIEFDADRGHVERTRAADQLDKYLYAVEETSRSWPRYYAGFVLISALTILLGVVTNLVSVGGGAVLFGVMCVGIAALAVCHVFE